MTVKIGQLRLFAARRRGLRSGRQLPWVAYIWVYILGVRLPVKIGVDIIAFVVSGLVLLNNQGVSVGVRVVAHARYLPRNFHSWAATGDLEATVRYLLSNIQIGAGRSDGGKLVSKVTVGRLEPCGHLHPG